MSAANFLLEPRKAIAIAKPARHIFFLSHMRAYSSLFGHIMGSHPQISGYYELHIGYHSWKSLVRQKMLFFAEEAPKPGYRYMFDKVLHNEHHVASSILDTKRSSAIFSLREPQKTIPSIIKLYTKEDPKHAFTDASFATRYYIERAQKLASIASELDTGYFYFDAEAITGQTDQLLAALTQWLNLSPPLNSNYSLQKKTSQSRYGDTSETLKSGKIERASEGDSTPALAPALLEEAMEAYTQCRKHLIASSCAHYLRET